MELWKSVIVCVLVAALICRVTAMPRSSEDLDEEDGSSSVAMKQTPQKVAAPTVREPQEINEEVEKKRLPKMDEDATKKTEGSTLDSTLKLQFPEDSKVVDLNEKDDAVRSKKSPGSRDQHTYMHHMPGTTVCIHVRSDHSQIVCGPQADDKKEENKLKEQRNPSARFAYQPSAEYYYGEDLQRNMGLMRSAQQHQLQPPLPKMQPNVFSKRVQGEPLPLSPFRANAPVRGPTSAFNTLSDDPLSSKPTEVSQPAGGSDRIPNVLVHRQYIPTPYVPQSSGPLRLNCAYQHEGIPFMQPFGMPFRAPLYSVGEQYVNVPANSLGARMVDGAEFIDEPSHFKDIPRQDQILGSPLNSETMLGSAFIDEDGNAYFVDNSQARASDHQIARQWEPQQFLRASEDLDKDKTTSNVYLKKAEDQLKELTEQVNNLAARVDKNTPASTVEEASSDKDPAVPKPVKETTPVHSTQPQEFKDMKAIKSSKRQVRIPYA